MQSQILHKLNIYLYKDFIKNDVYDIILVKLQNVEAKVEEVTDSKENAAEDETVLNMWKILKCA